MRAERKTNRKSVWVLRLLVLALIGVTFYGLDALNKSSDIYDDVSKTIGESPSVVTTATIGENTLKIPTYDMFKPGNLWLLVSKKQPLEGEAGYKLIDIPVAHGDEDSSMKIAVDMSDELQQLVNAAEADQEELMVSSAYRSLADQQAIYDEFVEENGVTVAQQYVSPVGASEHHTGLSVDLSSVSDECSDDSDSCSLSQSGAAWLAANAYKYGFVQRYPQGKQAVTGVAFEPWHFRFVGKPMAAAMNGTNLTFDEVIQQIAPGYGAKDE